MVSFQKLDGIRSRLGSRAEHARHAIDDRRYESFRLRSLPSRGRRSFWLRRCGFGFRHGRRGLRFRSGFRFRA